MLIKVLWDILNDNYLDRGAVPQAKRAINRVNAAWVTQMGS